MHRLFISDIHLSEQRPDLTVALLNFLKHKTPQADELYLLGDIFDVWIGDDYISPSLIPITDQLKQLSQAGVKTYLQHGNRDFLLGQDFAELCQIQILDEEHLLQLASGEQTLITHGDQYCIDDNSYQEFRKQVRNPQWQQAFLSKSLEERLTIAKQLRQSSQQQTALKASDITDINADRALQAVTEHQVQILIHGHTHRPAIHKQSTYSRIVLGDWDKYLWYLTSDEHGYSLEKELI